MKLHLFLYCRHYWWCCGGGEFVIVRSIKLDYVRIMLLCMHDLRVVLRLRNMNQIIKLQQMYFNDESVLL